LWNVHYPLEVSTERPAEEIYFAGKLYNISQILLFLRNSIFDGGFGKPHSPMLTSPQSSSKNFFTSN
jgi:hypothetical protein